MCLSVKTHTCCDTACCSTERKHMACKGMASANERATNGKRKRARNAARGGRWGKRKRARDTGAMEQHSMGMDWDWGENVHRPAVGFDLASGTFLHVGTAHATGAAQAGIPHFCLAAMMS